MPTFKMTVLETARHTVYVQADDEDEAYTKLHSMDPNDFDTDTMSWDVECELDDFEPLPTRPTPPDHEPAQWEMDHAVEESRLNG